MVPPELRRAASHVLLDDPALLDLDAVAPDEELQHHLLRVLRIRGGDPVSLTDGHGRWRMSSARVEGSTVTLEPLGDVRFEARSDHFTLATAIPKGDRLEWLVQKTTEIGVDRIVLIDAERSTVRWDRRRAPRQLQRLRRIADESVRQSRRIWRTEIAGPVPALDVLVDAAITEPGGADSIADAPLIAIGPEGGWTDRELACSGRRIDLGSTILRVETAAVVAAVLRLVR